MMILIRVVVAAILILGIPTETLAAEAQQSGKSYRVGLLLAAASPLLDDFRKTLRELGYVEGRNLEFVRGEAKGRLDQLPALAADLVQAKVDVIFAPSTTPVRAAKQATSVIPIVFATAGDPVGVGLVASLAHPGGNVTGISSVGADLAAKRLELLKQFIPSLSTITFIWRDAPIGRAQLRETEAAARMLGIQIHTAEIRGLDDLGKVFQTAGTRAQAVVVPRNPITFEHRRRVADLAAQHRLPAIYDDAEFAEAGGLLTYGPSLRENYRRAAHFVDKILKGARPADLPVEQPTKFELVINLKTAKALGLTIPPPLLLRADQVIE